MTYGRGAVLVVAAAALWSLMGLFIRQIGVADTWAVLLWRSVGSLPVLVALVAWRSGGRPLAALRGAGGSGVAGALCLVAAFAGAVYALQATSIANAVFLFSASPFFAAILGRLVLGEAVRRATWVAIAIAGAGMAVMVRDGLAGGALGGNLAALLSAAGFAAFTVTLRRGGRRDTLPTVVLGAALAAVVSAAMLAATGGSALVPPGDILWAVAAGAVLLGFGMALYTAGSRAIPAADLTLLSMVEVLLAPVWVWLLMGETASPATFAGGAIILGAVAFNAVTGARAGLAARAARRPGETG